ncbi:MAG: hypothetical protein HRT61_12060 [Ekhidna sp.]|nr:hypothetical protein [Ekhidna sp.]
MKREILFRGKCPTSGEWFFGFYFIDGFGNHCITDNKCNLHEVDPETVGQYTGLQDKNGVKIFEGDYINIFDDKGRAYGHGDVSFIRGGFQCNDLVLQDVYNENLTIEVTGNIHED